MAQSEAYLQAEKRIAEAERIGSKKIDFSAVYVPDQAAPKLTELPESVGRLTQLQALDLTGNELTSLPESLGRLTQLQTLELAYNRLTSLPRGLGELGRLSKLRLTRNRLTSLPDSMGRLTQLQALDLTGNELTSLPESLGRLTQLQELSLSHNQLASLPESLGRLTQLQTLLLAFNRLASLPEWLGRLTRLRALDLSGNRLTSLPEWLGRLTRLQALELANNRLTLLPESIGELTGLPKLDLSGNELIRLPTSLGNLASLRVLNLGCAQSFELPDTLANLSALEEFRIGRASYGGKLDKIPGFVRNMKSLVLFNGAGCEITTIPEWISELPNLKRLFLSENRIKDVPASLGRLSELQQLNLADNPLNPELAAAYADGLDAVKRYLRAKAEAQVVLNEAKLILVGEGEVGKSCLLGALRGEPWQERRPTTHGIEIKPVKVTDAATGNVLTLNGWDFGGQRVYRPTHQLFFSAPAVYLVVWKPREGPQQGFVKDWIKLVKHREPDAKILVVATHGGPGARQPDIDRQEIWDYFGKATVIDFFHVQSMPGADGADGVGIRELREAIARVAATLPEVGRTVPQNWAAARKALIATDCAYLPLNKALAVCGEHNVGEEADARVLLRICRSVGDLIHFEHDPLLRDVVILKPDWLATAMSYVLDDEVTRGTRGLVRFERLARLWNDPARNESGRYPAELHPIFLRLMERFDLSYRVADAGDAGIECTSLIAQLVDDVRPDPVPGWTPLPAPGEKEQVQVCRIVEEGSGQSANAEGLFYQLIVRLHKYSLGRADYRESVHWQRGLELVDDTGSRALLEHVANDVRIAVRSPYPERFLSALTYEVKYLVESFWKGMHCEVTVPCLTTRVGGQRCHGLFNVNDLLDDLRENRAEQKCFVCKKWQQIDALLRNAPAAGQNPLQELLANSTEIVWSLECLRAQLGTQQAQVIGRFDRLDASSKEIVSKVEAAYTRMTRTLRDEAKEGPRLFSFEPEEPGFFERPSWMSAKFRLTLWCEHSRVPLWKLSDSPRQGVYTINLPREWLVKAAPFLRVLSSTLGLVLPVVAAGAKVVLPDGDYKAIERQLALGKSTAEGLLKGSGQVGEWLAEDDGLELGAGAAIRAEGAVLRQLHAWLKEKDPSFGGLVRVTNRRSEFLWVHPKFENEY